MKNENEDIDKLIKETLTEEEAKFYDELEEQNLFQMLWGVFKGKNSWIAILMNIVNIIAFGLFIYCIIQTMDVKNTNDLILWVGASLLFFLVMSMIKIYLWMQIHRNALTRELKRLELQISSLSAKISD
jgi:fumarate reductase subunit D